MNSQEKQGNNLEKRIAAIRLKNGEAPKEFEALQKLLKELVGASKIEVLDELAIFYREEKQYKNEFETLEHILVLKESIFDLEKKERIAELQSAFETQEKDKLILQEKGFNKTIQKKNLVLTKALAKQKRLDLHLKSLQLQLSPHFIFNTLQSIQSYIFQQDPVEASDYLASFATLMRAILKASRQDAIILADEEELLNQYLLLEQKRFDDKFDFSIVLDGSLDKQLEMLPSLLLQPFIENAILHGIAGLKDGWVKLIFRKKQDVLYAHIIDNGIGRAAAQKMQKRTHQGSATALKIMRERSDLSKVSSRFVYDFKVKNRIKNGKASGTHVLLAIINKIK
jgi:sensor histidine kinase YesM